MNGFLNKMCKRKSTGNTDKGIYGFKNDKIH